MTAPAWINRHARVQHDVVADDRPVAHDRMCADLRPLAHARLRADHGKRPDGRRASDARRRVDAGRGMKAGFDPRRRMQDRRNASERCVGVRRDQLGARRRGGSIGRDDYRRCMRRGQLRPIARIREKRDVARACPFERRYAGDAECAVAVERCADEPRKLRQRIGIGLAVGSHRGRAITRAGEG